MDWVKMCSRQTRHYAHFFSNTHRPRPPREGGQTLVASILKTLGCCILSSPPPVSRRPGPWSGHLPGTISMRRRWKEKSGGIPLAPLASKLQACVAQPVQPSSLLFDTLIAVRKHLHGDSTLPDVRHRPFRAVTAIAACFTTKTYPIPLSTASSHAALGQAGGAETEPHQDRSCPDTKKIVP